MNSIMKDKENKKTMKTLIEEKNYSHTTKLFMRIKRDTCHKYTMTNGIKITKILYFIYML